MCGVGGGGGEWACVVFGGGEAGGWLILRILKAIRLLSLGGVFLSDQAFLPFWDRSTRAHGTEFFICSQLHLSFCDLSLLEAAESLEKA